MTEIYCENYYQSKSHKQRYKIKKLLYKAIKISRSTLGSCLRFLNVRGRKEHCVKSVQIRSFSGPYFPVFGLNTEIYSVNLCIQSKYRKIRTRKKVVFEHFPRSDYTAKVVNFCDIEKPGNILSPVFSFRNILRKAESKQAKDLF